MRLMRDFSGLLVTGWSNHQCLSVSEQQFGDWPPVASCELKINHHGPRGANHWGQIIALINLADDFSSAMCAARRAAPFPCGPSRR